jgi:hypothetical protein
MFTNKSQTTSHLLMIRPVRFEFNAQTAVNNAFQVPDLDKDIASLARKEFDDFASLLQSKGIDVSVVDDSPEPHTPDSVFPNNWVSFHADGTVFLYPMFAENRRLERKPEVLQQIRNKFEIVQLHDLSNRELQQQFLEGTGSMVLDRSEQIAYACLSPRTHPEVLEEFARISGYRIVAFDAVDRNGLPIYHTNVMMCVADRYVVICLDSIRDALQLTTVNEVIRQTGKEIIPISLQQMENFAGNMLQVENKNGEKFLVMSSQAYASLEPGQRDKLEAYNPILHSPLDTIEKNGGGSARCMLAEVFLPEKKAS